MTFLQLLSTSINYLLIGIFRTIRPLLGPASCKFDPSCGVYTVEQLRTQPTHTALWRILKQVIRCNPFF